MRLQIAEISEFRFSIWDLFAFTTFVAIMVALPIPVVQIIVAVSFFVLFFSVTLLLTSLISWRKIKDRPARAERFFIRFFLRSIAYSVALIVVGMAPIAVRMFG